MLLVISSEASSRASSSTSTGTWPDSQRVRAARAVAGAAGPTGSVASSRSIPSATHERPARRLELGEQVGVLVPQRLGFVHQPGDRDLLIAAPLDERDIG